MKQKKFKGKAIKLALTLTIAMVFGAVGMLPGVVEKGHAAMSYDVYIDDGISNGVVSTDKSETSGRGETVTLTVTPGEGYKLKKLSVIQPDVLSSISDLAALMGDAVFSLENEYFVKIDEGKFSVFHNDEKIASLDNSENFTNTYGAGGYYTANTENSGFWRFYVIGGKLRTIEFRKGNDNLTFHGTGTETISGTAIETTTVTEGTKYTFAAPASDVFVTAEFEMQDPKTVLIDVGAGHAALFTSDVLNEIKTDFELQDATISGNIITLKGVNPSTTEYDLWEGIEYFVHDLVKPAYYIHNGEKYMNTGYKAIDEYQSFIDFNNETYDEVHKTTPVSDNMTYYLLWAKPYKKLDLSNGNPTCSKENWSALPTAPGGFMVNPEDFAWRDENEEVVETFEGGKEYTFHGEVYRRPYGELWKYFLDPDNFTLTVKDGKVVQYEVDGNYVYVAFKATADHDWDAGTITKQPTTSADGVKTFKCKHCGATKTEKIPKLAPSKTKPAAPKVTTVAKTSARAMTVKWTMKWGKVNGAKSYKVAYRKVGSKKWTYKKTKKTQYVVKGHKMKGLYEYKVAAVSKKGSTWSNTSRRYFNGVKTTAKAGKGAIKVSWKKAKGASGYQVLVATNKKMKNARKYVVSKSAKTYKVKGLKSGKKYYVKVRPLKNYKGKTYKGILCKPKAVKVK